MKILSAAEIRDWDQYTITHEPVSSVSLMERAALTCVNWLERNNYFGNHFTVFCGKGNNGGDGLAIARILAKRQCNVTVYILESGQKGTYDFQHNLELLHKFPVDIGYIQTKENFHAFTYGDIIIDALFGSGLNRPADGIAAELIEHINESGCEIISLDLPSGLFADTSSKGNTVVAATHTLSFQCHKLAFMMAENAEAIGIIHILDIGLNEQFYENIFSTHEIVNKEIIKAIYKARNRFAHKGNFGHVLMIAGSYGKIGAAVLAAKACLRAGTGLLTVQIPKCGYDILQGTVPEAMVFTDFNSSFITRMETDENNFDAVGMGPGIGVAAETKSVIVELITHCRKPMVLDADALNILAGKPELYDKIFPYSILTPHPKEFERLFGKTENEFERIQLALQKAKELKVVIVLKGHHTFIATPGGKGFFNSTGNAGMATGGSGDVLTGILTSLTAQGYSSVEAAVLGVYLHGVAGNFAAKEYSQEAMIAGDITECLGKAFQTLLPE
jgi:ADP-dependent NAD(P)H-hydrate dehydratase / NAD(P)H-hydrate epimerase